jgi:hypothetical protein
MLIFNGFKINAMKKTAGVFFSAFLIFASIQAVTQVIQVSNDQKHRHSVSCVALSVAETTHVPEETGNQPYNFVLSGSDEGIYIGENWPQGRVILRSGEEIDTYRLRYNLLTDQMQFIDGTDTLAFSVPEEIRLISFSGREFVYMDICCDRNPLQGYFEIVCQGTSRLLLKHTISYCLPDMNDPEDETITHLYRDELFFISTADQSVIRVQCSRRSVLHALESHEAEIRAYLKLTGNKVRDRNVLVDIVAYSNSLD